MKTPQTIVLTTEDRDKLTALVESKKRNSIDKEAFEKLAGEINRAIIVAPTGIPHNVVTMNSVVHVYDKDGGETMKLTLCWPEDANPEQGMINVLAPLGVALLGTIAGDEIEWPVPAGVRRLRIERVLYQPEAATKQKRTHTNHEPHGPSDDLPEAV